MQPPNNPNDWEHTPRRVLVTGAGRGIGLALVHQLSHAGHDVWGTVRSLRAMQTALDAGASRVDIMDLADPDSIEEYGVAVRETTSVVDVLINNAGINSETLGAPDRFREGPFHTAVSTVLDQIEINAMGPLLLIRQLQPSLQRSANPVVMNISSQLGSMSVGAGLPFDFGYNASKAVLNMVTVCAATADPDVAYISVHPGWVQSDMGGASAAISTDESARGLISVLSSITLADSGRFFTWTGEEHPW